MNHVVPTELIELQVARIRARLTLRDVSVLSGVGYSDASRLLNGRLIHPDKLALVRQAITTGKRVSRRSRLKGACA